MPPLKVAVIGCGSRGRTYAQIAGNLGDRFQIIAAADPHPESLDFVEAAAGSPIARFPDAASLIAARPDVDLAIVATQDDKHIDPALAALDCGWHLLLEKPAATSLEDCMFDAHRYTTDKCSWLRMLNPDADSLDRQQILAFLTESPRGRCVWHCDNDAVDHQVLALEFESGITATFTMTAFDSGRRLTIHGTRGVLRGGPDLNEGPDSPELWIRDHQTETVEPIPVDAADTSGNKGHAGGDFGLIDSLDQLIDQPLTEDWLESHLIAFSAESSRLSGGLTIDLAALR